MIIRDILFAAGLALMSAVFNPANAAAPKMQKQSDTCSKYSVRHVSRYEVVRESETDSGNSLQLFVLVSPAAIDRDSLITVGCALGKRFADQQFVYAFILDNKRAAKRYNPQGEGNDDKTAEAFQAIYSFSRRKDSYGQSLEWRADKGNPYVSVDIDLGPPPLSAPAQWPGRD